MPFTPFHMGPGMFIKAAAPRHFSLVVFGMTQIALDVEVLARLIRPDEPLHAFWHTFLGAALVSAGLAILGKPLSQWIKRAWNRIAAKCRDADLSVSAGTTWVASCTGAFLGSTSHVLLDSLFHPDMEPFQPWLAANPLLGLVHPLGLEAVCIALGIAGLAWFLVRERREGKAKERTEG